MVVAELDNLREVGVGIVSFVLFVLWAAMVRYLWKERLVLTVAERRAWGATAGLSLFFFGLMLRSFELWWMLVAEDKNWPMLPGTGEDVIYLVILAIVIFGAVLVLRAFHPWPFWAALLSLAILVPLALVFV